jgi:acetylornithine deacetylase/succinyl-diaminopimelate desuccinylase-like protein
MGPGPERVEGQVLGRGAEREWRGAAEIERGRTDDARHLLHVDVKHYDPAEWSSPPLEGRLVDRAQGKAIVGRGAVNQKGPEIAFLSAIRAFRATGRKLPVNLVLVAEGEEEIGSPNFHEVIADPEVLAAMKKAKGVFIPGAGQEPTGSTTVELGAKGVVEL